MNLIWRHTWNFGIKEYVQYVDENLQTLSLFSPVSGRVVRENYMTYDEIHAMDALSDQYGSPYAAANAAAKSARDLVKL